MKSPLLVVVGSANVDLTFRTNKLPKPGETTFGTDFSQGFGGKGANQAVAAARLGANVAFVGKVGADEYGRAIRRQLEIESINLQQLGIDSERPTGIAAILVDAQGENAIVGVPGANLGLTPADIVAAGDLLRSSKILIAPCETMIETLTEAFSIAHAAGVLCILNPAPARELPPELLKNIDICVPNESELRTLSSLPTETLEEIVIAANWLRERGPKQVIVTLGSRGALLVDAESSTHVPENPVRAVDTSGAGDAFCGALATYLAEGDSLHEAARKANIVASISVTRSGTQASFPRKAEITNSVQPEIGFGGVD